MTRRVFPIQRYAARNEVWTSAEAMRDSGFLYHLAYAIFEARMQCIHGAAGAGMVTIPGRERVRVMVMVEQDCVDAALADYVDRIEPHMAAVEIVTGSSDVIT